MTVEDDGFTLARGGRRRRKFFFKACANISLASSTGSETTAAAGSEEMPLERLESKVKRVRDHFPAEYKEKVIAAIKSALEGVGGERIGTIRCIGLGNFNLPGHHHNSLYQLVLLESIMEEFKVNLVTSQEPVTGSVERLYLASRGIYAIPVDDLTRPTPECSLDTLGITLYFMIHCEAHMYDSVLSAFWSADGLGRLILLGNSYTPSILRQAYAPVCRTGEPGDPKPQPELLNCFVSSCLSTPLPHFHDFPNAFNDTAIHYVPRERVNTMFC